MRLLQTTTLCLAVSLTIALMCGCGSQQPSWVEHSNAASNSFRSGNFAEGDKEAKLVFEESTRSGGTMPPSADPPWEANIFPMQDLGEQLRYSGHLRFLAQNYSMANKLDDAERFYKKALELDSAKYGQNSTTVATYSLPPLIQLLESRGKTQEAANLQEQLASAAQAQAERYPKQPMYQADAFRAKAEALEKQGKLADAEAFWKKRVDLYRSELTDHAHHAQLKSQNEASKRVRGGMSMPSVVGALEDLAKFYARQKNYPEQEKTLLQAQSVREAVGVPTLGPKRKSDIH